MKAKNFVVIFSVSLLALSFVFLPFEFNNFSAHKAAATASSVITIDRDTSWKKSDNLLFSQRVEITSGATLTIEKGAQIKFSKGANDEIPTLNVLDGRILAKGTMEEKIEFTTDTDEDRFAINFSTPPNSAPSFFRYVKISKGGFLFLPELNPELDVSLPVELGAINYASGKAHFENCEFQDGYFGAVSADFGITDENKDDYLEIINSNFENNGDKTALTSWTRCEIDNYDCGQNILLKDNYYNHYQGPTPDGAWYNLGEKLFGTYKLDGFRENKMIADPLIIVPGIMGSEKIGDKWHLDPITHTYSDLTWSLGINGYKDNQNLFEFPYDWRKSNKDTAIELKNKIDDIIKKTKVSKTDLAAHSMGGLVARQYIESDDYADNVDQFITLGTPHRGAPKAYLYWEAGEGFFTFRDKIIKRHFKNEAEHNGYDNLRKYIQEKVISLKELLPDYDYLFDVSGGVMRNYSNNYPENTFLEELNKDENLDKLKKISLVNIIGNLDIDKSTINKIRIIPTSVDGIWQHGMPENFYDGNTDRGLEFSTGDATVPSRSAGDIASSKKIEINSSHADLPTEAQCEILKELTGKERNKCQYYDNFNITNLLMINVFSPIDIQVIFPSGQRVGKNFQTGEILNEIPGAYYTGSDTENEFLTIPNPEDGEYRILTQGTGEGTYRIEATKIMEDETTREAIESTAIIQGVASPGQEEEKTITISDNEVISETKDTTPPNIIIHSPQANQSYLNNQIIQIDYKITDNITEPENIPSQVFLDGVVIRSLQIDLALQRLGQHQIKITAQDEANNQSGKETTFQIETNLPALTDNVQHYFDLGLIKTKREKTTLARLLHGLSEYQRLSDKILANPKLSGKVRDRMRVATKLHFNRRIDAVIRHIEQRVNQTIDPQAGERLMEGLDFVRMM